MDHSDDSDEPVGFTVNQNGFSEDDIGRIHLALSDGEGDEVNDDQEGDYSARMEELFDDKDGEDGDDKDEDMEEGFVYSGMDTGPVTGGYKEQMRELLGPDMDDDELEAQEVERSLSYEEENETTTVVSDEAPALPDERAATPSVLPPHDGVSSRADSPVPNGRMLSLMRPVLHPTVSRLRSNIQRPSRVASSGSSGSLDPQVLVGTSPSPSQISEISRTSTPNSNFALHEDGSDKHEYSEREVFKWSSLRNAAARLYVQTPGKASTVLGSPNLGSPMVLAANGLICVGTDAGRVLVFDFRQTLKCICGSDTSAGVVGPVTALALSLDHTFVASGHASGYIQLFDLKNPQVPARTVEPASLAAVSAGRQEGHLPGSRITSIGFVAGRHTAVVSADANGLAFYHSLGKVLFVDASDVLRIFGNYPEDDMDVRTPVGASPSRPLATGKAPNTGLPSLQHLARIRNTIIAMMPLPLGTVPHSTDAYNVIALLTTTKLVIVGLKPTPKTWLKRLRSEDSGLSRSKQRRRGALAWYPSVSATSQTSKLGQSTKEKGQPKKSGESQPTNPILIYSWDNVICLLRLSESRVEQTVVNSRTGKEREVELGVLTFEESGRWNVEADVLAIQFLNVNQVAIFMASHLSVYDIRTTKLVERITFNSTTLMSPSLSDTSTGARSYPDSVSDIAHSIRAYKGKLFLLGRSELLVGTLLTWADRILSFVGKGDFLSAIELTRSYYVDEAPGNRNGLPDDLQQRREMVGEKMRDLMVASARYAFSDDRMTDGTHVTPDGRGVDRTSLFEGLVTTCTRACIALDDFEFLFEDLYQRYEDTGIARIFLEQMDAFILAGDVSFIPPRITQRLVALHEEDGHPDLVERIIWHINPTCLDINQAILICQKHHLWDALIYVYTRALKDYVSPIAELLVLIRAIHRRQRSLAESSGDNPDSEASQDRTMETMVLNAYKIYSYLADILSGLSYPSEEQLAEDEAEKAKEDVYKFLFVGRSSDWPAGDGKLVFTADEEGGPEPTYPYIRLLLRFDAESLLHSLDIAFEDSFLNDTSQATRRLVIVKILLEIMASGDLSPSDTTFVNIFIARNVSKYHHQYIQLPPSTLQSILISLASSRDRDTLEDRQLAAEYLLSAYTPHGTDSILRLFEEAGFFRILRSWHEHERQWAPLLSTYMRDPDIRPSEVFDNIDKILATAIHEHKGMVPSDVQARVTDSIGQLLKLDVANTASLIDKHLPDLHMQVLNSFDPGDDFGRYSYLDHLFGSSSGRSDILTRQQEEAYTHVGKTLRHLYISLQCRYQPTQVVDALKRIPRHLVDWPQVLNTCEEDEVYDAVMWALNWSGEPRAALLKAEAFHKMLAARIVKNLASASAEPVADISKQIEALQAIGRIGVDICLQHSRETVPGDVPLEDIWFQLLNSQINAVQTISAFCSSETRAGTDSEDMKAEHLALDGMRQLVQDTFGSLVSISSTRAVSFPRLFKRLVDPDAHSAISDGSKYTEFRTILTAMLESYRSDGDMLVISKHLVDRDLFDTVEEYTNERKRGCGPSYGVCLTCGQPLISAKKSPKNVSETTDHVTFVLSRTGAIYHTRCSPSGI